MTARLSKLVLAIALAVSIGLHWTLLQSVAWVGMVVSYSQSVTLKEALVKTFDGKHPCFICKEVDQGRKAQKKSEQQTGVKKLDLLGTREVFVFASPNLYHLLSDIEPSAVTVWATPPAPPPRSA